MEPRIFRAGPLSADTEVTLTGNPAAHIRKVLRLREGGKLILFNDSGLDHPAHITSLDRQRVIVRVGKGYDPGTESPLHMTLIQGICRSQRMDTLIQKSTELGVNVIRPVICERNVVRLDDVRAEKKTEHWRQVAISACEQCGRARIPTIAVPGRFDNLMSMRDDNTTIRLLLDPRADTMIGAALGGPASVALLIGPEGGLTDAERSTAIDAGFRPVKLGPRVLRTETAPVAALSVIQYLAGDLG